MKNIDGLITEKENAVPGEIRIFMICTHPLLCG
jgi:hypothetical protein